MNARLFLLPVIDVRGLLSKVYIYVCIIVGRRLIVSASLIQTNAIIAGIWQARKEETVSTLLITVNVFIRPRDRPFLLIKKRAWLRLSTSRRFFEQTNTFPLPSFLSFTGFPKILQPTLLDHRSPRNWSTGLSLSFNNQSPSPGFRLSAPSQRRNIR